MKNMQQLLQRTFGFNMVKKLEIMVLDLSKDSGVTFDLLNFLYTPASNL